jgi:tripartite-type tricarboxylate transporter receptor subunit TctC
MKVMNGKRWRLLTCGSLLVMLLVFFQGTVIAQTYPAKPITVIVAFAAGGGTDVAARLINQFAEKHFRQPLTVVNRTGAGGEIGFAELAKARPDGYVIGWINSPPVVTIPIQRKAAYSLADFIPIANIVYDPGVLAVRPGFPLDSVEKVIAEAKKNPGVVTYATTGIGGDDHLAMMGFEREAGVRLIHVPFDGAAQTMTALLGGHINLLAANEGEVLPHVRAGRMRVLAVMSERRLASLPEVPTFRELGINVVSSSARGIAVPRGTPEAIVRQIEEAFTKAVTDPEFLKRAAEMELPLRVLDSKTYGSYLRSQDAFYRSLWEKSPWLK